MSNNEQRAMRNEQQVQIRSILNVFGNAGKERDMRFLEELSPLKTNE
jgi:hypothetical protein